MRNACVTGRRFSVVAPAREGSRHASRTIVRQRSFHERRVSTRDTHLVVCSRTHTRSQLSLFHVLSRKKESRFSSRNKALEVDGFASHYRYSAKSYRGLWGSYTHTHTHIQGSHVRIAGTKLFIPVERAQRRMDATHRQFAESEIAENRQTVGDPSLFSAVKFQL